MCSSSSIVRWSARDCFLMSRMPLLIFLAASGSLSGPRNRSATIKITRISLPPMPNIARSIALWRAAAAFDARSEFAGATAEIRRRRPRLPRDLGRRGPRPEPQRKAAGSRRRDQAGLAVDRDAIHAVRRWPGHGGGRPAALGGTHGPHPQRQRGVGAVTFRTELVRRIIEP